MPTHSPLISSSDSGVSITRSAPKRCCSPTVARKTPPLTPTSSPSTTTLASSCMARASAMLTASTRVTSGMRHAFDLVALGDIGLRELGIEVVERAFWHAWSYCQIAVARCVHLSLTFGGKLFLLRLAPCLASDEICAQARDGLLLPMRLALL